MSLFEKLRKQEIKSPIQNGFNLNEWIDQDTVDARDHSMKLAGIIIFRELEAVRNRLQILMGKIKNIDYIDLIRLNAGILNRNNYILPIEFQNKLGLYQNFSDIRLDNNPLNNKYTLDELAISHVDMCINSFISLLDMSKEEQYIPVRREDVVLIEELNMLSQIYSIYESLWKEIRYEKKMCEISNDVITFYDIDNVKNKAWLCGSHRMNKLNIGSTILSKFELDSDKNFLTLKHGIISRCKFSELDEKLKISLNVDYEKFHNAKIWSFLPVIQKQKEDVLILFEIFSQLKSLAFSLNEQFPEDTNTVGENEKLLEYAPKLDFKQLKRNIIKNLKLSSEKFEDSFKILSFSKSKGKDIWISPVLNFGASFCLINHPIMYPNIDRWIEKVLLSKDIDISSKGLGYEKFLGNKLRLIISENKFINKDFDVIFSKRIRVDNREEEFDLILRIGNLIVIGEVKNNQFPEDLILLDRNFSYLEKGSEQVKRKRRFIEDNMEYIFRCLGWDLNTNNYFFKEIIIVNNYIGVGYSLYGVPIVDSHVLFGYFYSGCNPIISEYNHELKIMQHNAYLELYNDRDSLIKNFGIYVDDPPAVFNTKHNKVYSDNWGVLSLNKYNVRVSQSRINSNINIFEHKFKFELKIKNILKSSKNFDFIL